jgi:hypothetical protein
LHGLPWPGGFTVQSRHAAPADDCSFDWLAGIHTVPRTATPSAQKWNDIGADVILAKNFKRLVRRRHTLVSEGVDSFLSCHHAVRFSDRYEFDEHKWRCDGIATRLYKAVSALSTSEGRDGI